MFPSRLDISVKKSPGASFMSFGMRNRVVARLLDLATELSILGVWLSRTSFLHIDELGNLWQGESKVGKFASISKIWTDNTLI